MAGGRGVRMGSLTENLPKPMLPVGGRPLIDRIVASIKPHVTRITIAVHYHHRVIQDYFGRRVKYIVEKTPLGSGGALRWHRPAPLLVINGDILTNLDFASFIDSHAVSNADCTVLTARMVTQLTQYGVLEFGEDCRITGMTEKPTQVFCVNAGVYLFKPSIWADLESMPQQFGLGELIEAIIPTKQVYAYPLPEKSYWLDIGSPESYEMAEEVITNG